MPLTKAQKKETLDSLGSIFKDSGSVVFAKFHGLSVADAGKMRGALREKGISYRVVKKTLVRRALDESQVSGEKPSLEGELALAWSENILDPAREIHSFQKEFDGKISIMGGIFEGAYKDKDGMTEIALIPPRQTLYAQFVNLINSPIQGLVVGLNAVAGKKE